VKQNGNEIHVLGDTGSEWADYKVIQNGNGTHVVGDTGKEWADYKITL
jgi:hypothetical protein